MPSSRITSLCWKGYSSHLHRVLEQKEMIPGTTYIRTWYVHQHFLFDFPFHEIYRRLLLFTLGRMYNTLWYEVRVMCQMRMIPGTYCIAICLFERGWWYAWHLRSDQQTAVSLVGGGTHDTYVPPMKRLYRRGYPMKFHSAADARPNQFRLSSTCGAPHNHTNVPPVDAHVWRQLYRSAVARFSDSYCIFSFSILLANGGKTGKFVDFEGRLAIVLTWEPPVRSWRIIRQTLHQVHTRMWSILFFRESLFWPIFANLRLFLDGYCVVL